MKRRAINLLIALDQFLFCVICLGDSYPDETASSAAYRLEQQGTRAGRFFRPLIDMLFFLEPLHCYNSWLAEAQRKQAPSGVDA